MTELVTTGEESATALGASMLNLIAAAAKDPATDVEKLRALLDMQRDVLRDAAVQSFNHALARVAADMPRVSKAGTIKLGENKGSIPFARWEDMDTVLRPLLRQEGFTLSFDMPSRDEKGAVIAGTLLHRDGHSITRTIILPQDNGPGRNPLQAMGSTLSYGKRYTTEMLLNIVRAGVDDDGTAGGTQYVSREQGEAIEAELAKQGIPREAFLHFMDVKEVADIRLVDYRKAMNSIAATGRSRAERGRQP